MQAFPVDGASVKLTSDERFIKNLHVNARTGDAIRSLMSKGFLEIHAQAIVDAYRNGTALQSHFVVLDLHWTRSPVNGGKYQK